MKRLATFVFAMLLASSLSFAQAGGGDKPKTDQGATTDTGKKSSKKAKKASKKKKKGSTDTATQPPK
jgi:hypothetical protein